MGIGQIIADTFGTLKSRLGPLLAVWAVYFLITIVCWFAFTFALGASSLAAFVTSDPTTVSTFSAGTIFFMILFYIAYLLLMMAQYASLVVAASPIASATGSEALDAGWRSAPALFLLLIVLVVAYLLCVVVIGLAGMALSMVAGNGIGAVLLLVLLPVVIWLAARLTPLLAVIAVDGVRNPFDAIARAWALTRGHALTIFLALLALVLIMALVATAVMIPFLGTVRAMTDPANLAGAPPFMGGGIIMTLLGFAVLSVFCNLLQAAFQAVVHARLTQGAREAPAVEI